MACLSPCQRIQAPSDVLCYTFPTYNIRFNLLAYDKFDSIIFLGKLQKTVIVTTSGTHVVMEAVIMKLKKAQNFQGHSRVAII